MSYTKMQKEIDKYIKENNLDWAWKTSGTAEETKKRIYDEGRNYVYNKWIVEEKYKELISVAHQGWFSEDDFLIPLAKHLVKEKELDWLRFLCERQIRFLIEDTLKCLKYANEEYPNKDQTWHDNQLQKTKNKSLDKINRYITFLEKMDCYEYLERIKDLKSKTENLTIKLSDLKIINIKV